MTSFGGGFVRAEDVVRDAFFLEGRTGDISEPLLSSLLSDSESEDSLQEEGLILVVRFGSFCRLEQDFYKPSSATRIAS